jgi:hypothetical protein
MTLQKDPFHDDPFGDLLAADTSAAQPAPPPAAPPPAAPPPAPPTPMAGDTEAVAPAPATAVAGHDSQGDPFLALTAQPASAATSGLMDAAPAAPAGTAVGFDDFDPFGAASHDAASSPPPPPLSPPPPPPPQQQEDFASTAPAGSLQEEPHAFSDPFAGMLLDGAGEGAQAGALREAGDGTDGFQGLFQEPQGGDRQEASRASADEGAGLDATGGMELAAGA